MRLIDADEFKQQISAITVMNGFSPDFANKMCEIIDNQPTAYDVNDVIVKLEEYSVSDICRVRKCNSDDYSCEHCGAAGALEIVKAGIKK